MKVVNKSIEFAGRTLSFEVNRFAPRATSSVLARYGESTVLVTVALGKEDLKKDYFPLSVEYQERFYAGGRIRGSKWIKREGRGSDAEVLSGRLIDRSIRPLFPSYFRHEVQVIITVLTTDTVNDTDILALNAASAAIAISPIPWAGPVAAVRMGLDSGKLIVNPLNGNKPGSDLDLVVTSSDKLIDMIEAGANQVSEDVIYQAFETAHTENQKIISMIKDLVAEIKPTKIEAKQNKPSADLVAAVTKASKAALAAAMDYSTGVSWLDREHAYGAAKETIAADFPETDRPAVMELLEELLHQAIRDQVLDKKVRVDGRKVEEIRQLHIEAGVLPRVHGSGIFQRGETQVLSIATLGAPSLAQALEDAEGESEKRYMHHYNMPPYATGEAGRVGGPGRREIGHGALAERGIAPVIPPESEFPYAIRVVSEIMSSNGSTSMASTCGSTLALMDAGVPLIAPVAGISTGLITPEDYPLKTDRYELLTDINGGEDHHGDMDFKVAGTTKGITAIQLDVKVPGLTLEICKATLERARTIRLQILDAMLKVIPEPRKSLSAHAPKISVVTIPTDKIGELIGPGGKNIKKLMAETGTQIDTRDDGSIFVSGTDEQGVATALGYISGLGKEVQAGEIYEGVVARIQPFGAFVNILPGKDGLVHVSQMAQGFVSDPNTIVHEGQEVRVWVIEIDDQNRISLSMLFDESGQPLVKAKEERAPRAPRPPMGGPRNDDSFRGPRLAGRDRGPRRRF